MVFPLVSGLADSLRTERDLVIGISSSSSSSSSNRSRCTIGTLTSFMNGSSTRVVLVVILFRN